MAIKGAFISCKEAQVFFKCCYQRAQIKMRVIASANSKFKKRGDKTIPDIKKVTYQEFADALNISLQELEIILSRK